VNQSRTLPLLGPAAVLYLVADVASTNEAALRPWDVVIGVLALVLSAVSYVAPRGGELVGVRRVGALGIGAGVALLGLFAPEVPSLPRQLGVVLGAATVGGVVLDLALSVPDAPAVFRGRLVRGALALVAAAAGASGMVAVLPPIPIPGREDPLLVPAAWESVPAAFALVAVVGAQMLRTARPRLGSGAGALAANAWALLGLLPASLGGSVAAGLIGSNAVTGESPWVAGLLGVAAVTTVAGHLAMVDPRRRYAAGRATRQLTTGTLTLVLVSAAVALRPEVVPTEPRSLAVAVAALLLGAVLVQRALAPVVAWVLAPARGRLLEATQAALASLDHVRSLEELAEAVLPPLRRASRDLDAEPLLFLANPAREIRVDKAGYARIRPQPMPSALSGYLGARPTEILIRDEVEPLAVRRPDLRPVIEVLGVQDAFVVVPCVHESELEGCLVVPRGHRRSLPSLEELGALETVAVRISGLATILAAEARAQERAGTLLLERDRFEERVELLLEEREKLLEDTRALKAGHAQGEVPGPLVAYSPAMREVAARIDELARLDAPVYLEAESGVGLDRVAQAIHRASPRRAHGLVIADCAAVAPEAAAVALFGEAGVRSGWLELARQGTLLLRDVPALPLEVQGELATAVADRRARWVGGPGTYEVDVRLLCTGRRNLDALREAEAVDEELAQRLAPLRLRIPPLRERTDDLRSLAFLALDRACRVLGRPALGIDDDALALLRAHPWPGNLAELQSVLDRAALAAEGRTVTRRNLEALAELGSVPPRDPQLLQEAPTPPPEAEAPDGSTMPEPEFDIVGAPDPLDGTYAAVERRLLERALEKTGGNKSAAARLLGLKRTTFLDKVRRHDLLV